MNFTREPIIETIITPREGCKIVVRNSKGNGQEDYFVDAVEVVSFGHSFFFRSQERPKSFLVPVSDYEILELKETRMILKNASPERSIKIGGGRDVRPSRESASSEEGGSVAASGEPRSDRKREKRRRGRRGGRDSLAEPAAGASAEEAAPSRREEFSSAELEEPSEGAASSLGLPEEPKPASFISKLFPPPPTLIKDTIGRYKSVEAEAPLPIEELPQDDFEPPIPSIEEDGDSEEE